METPRELYLRKLYRLTGIVSDVGILVLPMYSQGSLFYTCE